MKNSNVIIVCNGESVLLREFGFLINSFDFVVRMGNFKIKGFEKYVGTKTDIIINRGKQIYDKCCLTDKINFWSPHKIKDKEKMYYNDYLSDTEIKKIKFDTNIDTPTTGLIAYYLAKKFIPEKKNIYYCGMDFHVGGEYWDKAHSHAKIALRENVNHEPAKERLWFTKMVADKSIFRIESMLNKVK